MTEEQMQETGQLIMQLAEVTFKLRDTLAPRFR